MRVAIAQVNPTVGDLTGNKRLVEEAAAKAAAERADLVVLPEMVLTGYPPMDLLERDGFVRDQLRVLEELQASTRDIAIALGAVTLAPEPSPQRLMNSAVLLANGQQLARAKTLLPTYDVFDERRWFTAAAVRETVPLGNTKLGLTVCEDTWADAIGYPIDPVGELAAAGANVVVNLASSPWHVGKTAERRAIVT